MNRTRYSALAFFALTAAAACHKSMVVPNDGAIYAKAYLLDTAGRERGKVSLRQAAGSSQVELTIEIETGASTGQHGIHFHSVGVCDKNGRFASAGGHFNPGGRKHGLLSADGPHAGDLEAITVDYLGNAKFVTLDSRISLTPGPNSLLDADGSAIVLHMLPDDQKTDPSGGSGDRLACGVVTRQ